MQLQPLTLLPDEIAAVLLHYDLAPNSSIKPFHPGSPYSPKALITTPCGIFLLKRRAPGRDDPANVAFSHHLQLYLHRHHFPLPQLQRTHDHQTFLALHDSIYELLEFLPAAPYDRSSTAAQDAGHTLARYHQLLQSYPPPVPPTPAPPPGLIHNNPLIPESLQARLRLLRRGIDGFPVSYLDDLRALLGTLLAHYTAAAHAADFLGLSFWPAQITHADWHPANLLFINQHVAGVLDFDAARTQPRVLDLASAAAQFCTFAEEDTDPATWPPNLDLDLFQAFLLGYNSLLPLTPTETEAIPHLMIEAIIAESVLASRRATDLQALDAYLPWLDIARRKTSWILDHADT